MHSLFFIFLYTIITYDVDEKCPNRNALLVFHKRRLIKMMLMIYLTLIHVDDVIFLVDIC